MNIKPLRKRLDAVAKRDQIRLDVLQQDYLLSWVLVSLYSHPLLKNSLVFKGGTALKKCYFGEYRFSEDLDFTATQLAPTNQELFLALEEVCEDAQNRMNEYAPIRLEFKRHLEKNPHPHGQEAFSIHGQFPWQREPLTKVMVEISKEEHLLLNSHIKPILHNYDETVNQQIRVYALEEIVLEKLRAILQHTKKLHEREISRSRARDYYDLWRIFGMFENQLNLKLIRTLLPLKCDNKGVSFKGVNDFFDPKMIAEVEKTWNQWLGPLVSELPDCGLVLNELKEKIAAIVRFTNPKLVLAELIQKCQLKNRDLYQICERAIRAGVDINQPEEGLTPFQLAVLKNDKKLADLILSNGGQKIRPPGLGYANHYDLYKE